MVDISQTAASVAKGTNDLISNGTFGETIVAGDVVYLKAADSRIWKAVNSAAASAAAVGVALCGGAAGQPGTYLSSGTITPGGTVVVGELYCVSTNAGKFAPDADITSGMYRTVLGIGKTATTIALDIQVGAVAIP